MGLIANISNAMKVAAAARAAGLEAHRRRMMPYNRGYDVFRRELTEPIASEVKGRFRIRVLIYLILCGAVAFGIAVVKIGRNPFLFMFLILLALIFGPLLLLNLFRLIKMILGKYDIYGAMVTDKRTRQNTSTDSEGNTTTTTDYFLSLNCIETEVTSREYNRVRTEEYCFFLRILGKYQRRDVFYVFPADASRQDERIGQHLPSGEMRLYSAPKGSAVCVLMAILTAMAALFIMIAGLTGFTGTGLMETISANWKVFMGGAWGLCVMWIFINHLVSAGRAKEMLRRKQEGQ